MAEEKGKKRVNYASAWQEARALMWAHRGTLAIGLALVLVNRVVGFVMPLSPKFLGDTIIDQNRPDLLLPMAVVAGLAVLVQSVTSFTLAVPPNSPGRANHIYRFNAKTVVNLTSAPCLSREWFWPEGGSPGTLVRHGTRQHQRAEALLTISLRSSSFSRQAIESPSL